MPQGIIFKYLNLLDNFIRVKLHLLHLHIYTFTTFIHLVRPLYYNLTYAIHKHLNRSKFGCKISNRNHYLSF